MAGCRLSITIVTYHPDRRMLGRSLDSLAQACRIARAADLIEGAALYVVDNGPEEERAALRDALLPWPKELGAAELVSGHGNVGYGRANNLVLGRLDSDFHLVMNPDVELASDALEAALRTMAEHPETGMIAPAVVDETGGPLFLCKRYPSLWILAIRGFAPAFVKRWNARGIADYEMRDVIGDKYFAPVPLASGCFMLTRTALFKKLGGFDPRFFLYFEDYDLSLRVGKEGQIAYVPEVRIVHHGGEAARKGLRHILWFATSALRFFSKHGRKIF